MVVVVEKEYLGLFVDAHIMFPGNAAYAAQ
jgi:hypothetical protein